MVEQLEVVNLTLADSEEEEEQLNQPEGAKNMQKQREAREEPRPEVEAGQGSQPSGEGGASSSSSPWRPGIAGLQTFQLPEVGPEEMVNDLPHVGAAPTAADGMLAVEQYVQFEVRRREHDLHE